MTELLETTQSIEDHKMFYLKNIEIFCKSFKIGNPSLRGAISFIYFSFFGLKTLFYLMQQCIYVAQDTTFRNPSHPGMNDDHIISVRSLKNLMNSTGVVYRSQGTAGIFYYSVMLSGVIIFCLPDWFPGKRVNDYLNDKNLIRFLESPAIEYERISKMIDFHLKHIKNSNIEFTREIIKESTIYRDIYSGISKTIVENNYRMDAEYFSNLSAKDVLLYTLSYQLEYLDELSLSKCKVWPPNRNPDWAQKIKHFWLILDRYMSIIFWILGQGFCLSSQHVAYLTLNEFSGTQKLSFIDRITLAETLIAIHVLITYFLIPITVTITAVRDQLFSVRALEFRLLRINEELRKINSELDRKIKSNLKFNRKSLSYLGQNELIAQLDYDREAIEIYISFRIFSNDIKSSLSLARKSIDMHITFIIISLTLTLALSNVTSHADQSTLLVIGIYLTSASINGTFCMLAALHASCINLTKLIWTFIACVERYTVDKTLPEFDCAYYGENHSNTSKTSLFFLENSPINIDFNYFAHSPINPHTLLLWRRLLERYEYLREQFVCKAFGVYKIDYECILSFNYWLTSISLFLLATRG